MRGIEQPEQPAPEHEAEQETEKAYLKKVKKDVASAILILGGIVGGFGTAAHEINKVDLADGEKQIQKDETRQYPAVVSEKITVPAHVQPMPTMVGKAMGVVPIPVPEVYSLRVSIEGCDRIVPVEKALFDSIAIGEQITVLDTGDSININTSR